MMASSGILEGLSLNYDYFFCTLIGTGFVFLFCSTIPRENICSFKLACLVRGIQSFLTAEGLILCVNVVHKTTVLRTDGNDIPKYFLYTICKNSSFISLPNTWFDEVDDFLRTKHHFFIHCLMFLLYFCLFFKIINSTWATEGMQIRELITVATSTILPYFNREQHTKELLALMLSKVEAGKKYFLKSVLMESLLMLLGISGLMLFPVISSNHFLANITFQFYQELPVYLNGSEWIVDCKRQLTTQDVFTLTRCAYGQICIAPNDTIYFDLSNATWYCFLILVCVFGLILMCRMYELCRIGHCKMNDVLIMSLLKNNVDYKKHKQIIDDFEDSLKNRTAIESTSFKGRNEWMLKAERFFADLKAKISRWKDSRTQRVESPVTLGWRIKGTTDEFRNIADHDTRTITNC